jgi:hypothetical protein
MKYSENRIVGRRQSQAHCLAVFTGRIGFMDTSKKPDIVHSLASALLAFIFALLLFAAHVAVPSVKAAGSPDAEFASNAASGGMLEVKLGMLAAQEGGQ